MNAVPPWRIFLSIGLIIFAVVRIAYKINKVNGTEKPLKSSYLKEDEIVLSEKEIIYKDIKAFAKSMEYQQKAKNFSNTTTKINDKIEIKLTAGFVNFPDFQSDSVPLIAYANFYIITVEKKEKDSQQTRISQWNVSQHSGLNLFSLAAERPIKVSVYDENSVTYKFSSSYGERYTYMTMKEDDIYRYYFSISGPYEEYTSLKKYLKYYLKIKA